MPGPAINYPTPQTNAPRQLPPQVAFLLGGGCLFLALLLYALLWRLEATGGRVHLHAAIVAIYELGGKNLVAGSLAALGGFFCW